MPRVTDPAISCAENVAIASLFHSIPVAPSANPTDCVPKRNHTLSFEQERDLAKTLAFLAHIHGDAEHIPAVCLKEDTAGGYLDVLIAVNKAKASNGEGILGRIKKGLDGIFEMLSRGSNDDFSVVKTSIFHAVVSLCSARIISRLRLRRQKGKDQKKPFSDTLREILLALETTNQNKVREKGLVDAVNDMKASGKEARKAVDSWIQHQVHERLIGIVESVYQIKQIQKLQNVIDLIPNDVMELTARKSFVNILGKISHYREVSRFLYRMAKEVPLARRMRAVLVHLPATAYTTPSMDKYIPDLEVKITEATSKKQQQKALGEVCRLLGLSEQQAKKDFCQQVKKTLKKSKIHAEVQLVAYWAINWSATFPRIVCSSKDACFLCNLFIKTCGKIHTPRSHGVLYPGWRLPRLPQLQEVERRFCQLLQSNFEKSCRTLLSTKRRTLYPSPLESTLFKLPLSATTLSADGSLVDNKLADTIVETHEVADLDPQNNEGFESSDGLIIADHETESMESDKSLEKKDALPDPAIESAPSIECTISEPAAESNILQGCGILGMVGSGETSKLYHAGPLEIIVEGCTGSQRPSYHIEWLNATEALEVLQELPVTNAEDLHEASTFTDRNPLYISARGSVLRLGWTMTTLNLGT